MASERAIHEEHLKIFGFDRLVSGDGGVLSLIGARYALRVIDRGHFALAGAFATAAEQPVG